MKKAFSKILFIFILAIILGVIYFVWDIYTIKHSRQNPPASQAPEIQVIIQGDKKIVKNLTDGYQVTIPKEWEPNKTPIQNGLSILTPKTDSCNYSISKIPNPKNILAREWFNSAYGDITSDAATIKDTELLNYKGIEVTERYPRSGKSVYLNIDNYIFDFSYYPLNQNCEQELNNFIATFKNL